MSFPDFMNKSTVLLETALKEYHSMTHVDYQAMHVNLGRIGFDFTFSREIATKMPEYRIAEAENLYLVPVIKFNHEASIEDVLKIQPDMKPTGQSSKFAIPINSAVRIASALGLINLRNAHKTLTLLSLGNKAWQDYKPFIVQ
jgi:hypothetical protein